MQSRRLFLSGIAFTGLAGCVGSGAALPGVGSLAQRRSADAVDITCPQPCGLPTPNPKGINLLSTVNKVSQIGATAYSTTRTDSTTHCTANLTGSTLVVSNKQYGTSYSVDISNPPAIGQHIAIASGSIALSNAYTMNAYDSQGNVQATLSLEVSAQGTPTGKFSTNGARQGLNGATGAIQGFAHWCTLARANMVFATGTAVLGGFELVAGVAAGPPTLGAATIGAIIGFGGDVGFLINSWNQEQQACR